MPRLWERSGNQLSPFAVRFHHRPTPSETLHAICYFTPTIFTPYDMHSTAWPNRGIAIVADLGHQSAVDVLRCSIYPAVDSLYSMDVRGFLPVYGRHRGDELCFIRQGVH